MTVYGTREPELIVWRQNLVDISVDLNERGPGLPNRLRDQDDEEAQNIEKGHWE